MKLVDFKGDYSAYINGETVNLGPKHGKVKLTGDNLVKLYNVLISANMTESYKDFEKRALDKNRVSEVLSQLTLNGERESKNNLLAFEIDKKGNYTMPLFEPGIEYNTSSLFLSWFKKGVNKQTIKGGSLV